MELWKGEMIHALIQWKENTRETIRCDGESFFFFVFAPLRAFSDLFFFYGFLHAANFD